MCEWCRVAPLLFIHPIHGPQGPQRSNSCRQADILRTSATSLNQALGQNVHRQLLTVNGNRESEFRRVYDFSHTFKRPNPPQAA